MVAPDRIEDEGLSADDVLQKELVMPEDAPTEPHWVPEWDEWPEEQPGDEAWMDEDSEGRTALVFTTDDGFRVELVCLDYSDWQARIGIPEDVGSYIVDEHTFKARHPVMLGDIPMGYVDEVLWRGEDSYDAEAVVIRISEAEGMPVSEVESFVRGLREEHAETLQGMDDLGEKLNVARENKQGN
jgi:hypothetical protein